MGEGTDANQFEDTMNQLPEFYVTQDGQRVDAPTYVTMGQCQILMASPENGAVGPTLVEPGEVITTEMVPNHMLQPLNRAAAERIDDWLASLPVDGQGLTQADISEAAYLMRPREGEKELPHEQWYPAMLKAAWALKEKRSRGVPRPVPSYAHRPGANLPIMPNAAQQAFNGDPSLALAGARVPDIAQRGPVARSARGRPPADRAAMANTTSTNAPPQAAG